MRITVQSPATSFDIGAYLQTQNFETEQDGNNQVTVLVYPSGGAITITLPPTDLVYNLSVLVSDPAGLAATHNITVAAGLGVASGVQEKINGNATESISTNYGSLGVRIATTGLWNGSKSN